MFNRLFTIGILAVVALTPLSVFGKVSPGFTQKGVASYYSDKLHGRKTASGERYDKTAYTAAHRTLPLGTRVQVTNIKNGKSIELRINDRGPFIKGRIIDLSRRAARDLGMIKRGIGRVRVKVLSLPGKRRS